MNQTYCAAPWRGLHINLDGDIRLCCAGQPGSFGNVKTDALICLTESGYLREIRDSIKRGVLHPEYCAACVDSLGRGEREWFLETHDDIDYQSISADRAHEFQSIDLRWNNTCNLACTYCSPYFSSTWAQIKQERSNQPPSRQFDDIVDQIRNQNAPVKTMMLVGGEPLLIPHNERLVSAADEDTTVVVITNLSVPLESNRVFQSLKPLPRVNWNVSLENTAERFEFVRRGADWSLLIENLDILWRLFPNHTVSISAIYHIFNCTRLREFMLAMRSRNINVNWNTVSQGYLDPRFHDQQLRDAALGEIQAVRSDPAIELSSTEQRFFARIETELLQNLFDPGNKKRFYDHIADDAANFERLWPELAGIMR